MAGFHLTTGNDQQRLLSCMGEVFRANPPSHVFEPERIVVQSLGMQRWISLRLADQLGIFSNCSFLFPNQLLSDIFERVLPGFKRDDLFDREEISWKTIELLPGQLDKPPFKSLKNYLFEGGDFSQAKAWQLAGKIAYLYDQYCMYRPEMITDWEAGKCKEWQAELWRTLRENGIQIHLPALRQSFFKRIRDPHFSGTELPERISVFGITSLPPLHIDVLAALSHLMDVHLFFLNPSPAYWGDILSSKEMVRHLKRQDDPNLSEEVLHMEQGNPLLASFGKTGRSFFDLVQGSDFSTVFEEEQFLPPDESTLLGAVQADIFHLLDPDRADYPLREFKPDDASLQVHSFHSRMREVEVLHDQLQLMMTQNPNLKPGDILVMAPDINLYAPIIKAVFTQADHDRPGLPYSIADRSFRQESRVIQWFFKLLSLPHSRFRMSEILDLLESDAILGRYGIAERDISLLQDWLTSTNIRWGIDPGHKKSAGTPAIQQNSWEFGLDRLLLGLAMPDDGGPPFEDILPFDRIEGSQGILLGKFLTLFSNLKALVQAVPDDLSGLHTVEPLARQRSLPDWVAYLQQLLTTFFEENELWEDELQVLRNAINELKTVADRTETPLAVGFEVIQIYLTEKIDQTGTGLGFLGSGITFCSMLPMRSIPFRVVAILGLNDQAFPRKSQPLGFDLMTSNPKPGDRSIRDDDRYLFLEAILSAEEILYISYIGQSVRDNSTIPPSIVISELFQYLQAAGVGTEFGNPGHIATRHHLQAFNPNYFIPESGLCSFSADNLDAARVLSSGGSKQTSAPFIETLPEPEEQPKTVQLEELISFFDNPCRFLLRQRLGLNLDDESAPVEDAEAFSMSGLDKYNLDKILLEELLNDRPTDVIQARYRSGGLLPPGTAGDSWLKREQDASHQFANTVKQLLGGDLQPSQPFDLELGGFQVQGTIEPVYPAGLVHFRLARIKTRDRLTCWIKWLVLNLVMEEHKIPRSIIAGLDAGGRQLILQADPVENAESYLLSMLALFNEGLSRPLPFFPSSAESYVQALEGRKPESALQKAQNTWHGTPAYREKDDPYFAKCFGHTDPIDETFMEISSTILKPVFTHYKEF